MTYSFETVNLLRERGEVVPDGVAADALIFCAPRPLLGTKTWQGDWATPLPQPFCKVKQEKLPKFTKFSLFWCLNCSTLYGILYM